MIPGCSVWPVADSRSWLKLAQHLNVVANCSKLFSMRAALESSGWIPTSTKSDGARTVGVGETAKVPRR